MNLPKRRGRRFVPFLLVVAAAWPASVARADPAEAAVSYLVGDSVYVAAGERDGVVVGSRLRGTDFVLEVTETSARRSIGRVVAGDATRVAVGAPVTYQPVPAATGYEGSGSRRTPAGLHGRIGVRYLATRNGPDDRADVSSPAIDLRLDGRSLYGSPWNLHVDVRARRVTTTLPDGSDHDDDRNRVYRASFGRDAPGPGWRFAAGRQVAPELANVSVFDGVTVALDGVRTGGGAFVGTQPDGVDWGFSSDVEEAGGWYGVRSTPGSSRRWSVNVGAVASREEGEINREFAFAQGRYATGRVQVYAAQEIDVNRDWKKDEAGESSLEPTSSYVTVRYRATDAWAVFAGYDNRRNVRLYRDRVTPATEFDDAFRRGAWGGVDGRIGRHLRVGVSGRSSSGGTAGDATSYTGRIAVVRWTGLDLGVQLRATRWENDRLDGWLYTGAVSIDPVPAIGFTVSGGVRDETSALNPALDDSVAWVALDVDIDLAAGFWGTMSFERSEGDFEEVDRMYATLAWRF